MTLYFYEKPGCVGNASQKAVLRQHGCTFEVRDLLTEPWTAERLRPFFGTKPVSDWFNQSAPQVKSGEVLIHKLDEGQALMMMLHEPLLIRRPLMQVDELRQSGFEDGPVLAALGVQLDPAVDLQSCPMGDEPEPSCGEPA